MKILFFTIFSFMYLHSLELITTLDERASENYFYNQIRSIHNVNFYINDFIMLNGKIPTKIDLIATYNPGITNVLWPKTYASNTQIDFFVDFDNNEVRYTNITSQASSVISNLFKYNVVHKSDTIINTSDTIASEVTMTIPMNLEVVKFVGKLNIIVNDGDPDTLVGDLASFPCTLPRAGKVLYVANGSGNFDLYKCIFPNFRILSIFNLENYYSSLFMSSLILPGTKIYSDINATHARIDIYDNNKTNLRLTKP